MILLDVARDQGVDVLAAGFVIDSDSLARAARRHGVGTSQGDIVLVRSGWGRYWQDPKQFINNLKCPGLNREGATWLSERRVFAGGSDTLAFEVVPAPSLPVHIHLLVESGIHIIEALNLETLAAERVYEFVFVASPLRIRGGTASRIRPVALASH